MDSLTHIVLGAVIGEAYAGKKIGKRAMLYGAITQSLPDIDFVASFWLAPADNLLAHRGITHSIIFALTSTILLGLFAYRWHRASDMTATSWMIFFGLEIFTHLFIDAFNAYGVGWFEPFNHSRITFNVLFVADLFFSFGLIVAFVALLILNNRSKQRKIWTSASLTLSVLYLSYSVMNKITINDSVEENLGKQNITHSRFFTTPTALNTWLWYIVAEDDRGYHIGYQSIFDTNKHIEFNFIERNETLLKPLYNNHDLNQLMLFSRGYYTVENWGDTIIFNDLKFGQIMGWEDPNAKFVFHYYLTDPQQNLLVIQRGRFAGWNRKSVEGLIDRIKGN